jgi:ABC-type transport system involved in multi-copper enzyme maturation permease subunit
MRGTLLIARLTWLETRRRKIALAALICGLLFLAVFATAMYFGFRLARAGGPLGDAPVDVVGMRVAAAILTVAGFYVVNFLVNAVAILLPIDSLAGEINSGVIQTLASKPIDRAAIVVGKWLAYLLMTAAYLALLCGGIVLSMRLFADYVAPAVLAPMGLMLLGAAAMLSITIAGGVRLSTITNGIVAFGFYGIAFIAGWMEQILSLFENSTAKYVGTIVSLVSPTDSMWRRAAYEMQPLATAAIRNGPFGVVSVPSSAMIVWTVLFVVFVLAFAAWQFRRRPL